MGLCTFQCCFWHERDWSARSLIAIDDLVLETYTVTSHLTVAATFQSSIFGKAQRTSLVVWMMLSSNVFETTFANLAR